MKLYLLQVSFCKSATNHRALLRKRYISIGLFRFEIREQLTHSIHEPVGILSLVTNMIESCHTFDLGHVTRMAYYQVMSHVYLDVTQVTKF